MEEMAVDIQNSLQKSGWFLKPSCVVSILENLMDEQPSQQQTWHSLVLSHLLDSDLADVGAPCLPVDMKKATRIHGPMVLQVASVKNICESSSKGLSGGQHGRLLRIGVTDGCTTVSLIEYQSMPAFSFNTAPGTKVKLEKGTSVQNGILLGDARSISILGGCVQSLFDSWEMERKYSVLARASLKSARADGDTGPPPFHGLSLSKQEHKRQLQLAPPVGESTKARKDDSLQVGMPDLPNLQNEKARPAMQNKHEKGRNKLLSHGVRLGCEVNRPKNYWPAEDGMNSQTVVNTALHPNMESFAAAGSASDTDRKTGAQAMKDFPDSQLSENGTHMVCSEREFVR